MNPDLIIAQVAEDHCISPADITGPRRFQHIYLARQDAIVRLRNEGMTFADIGLMLNRDNSTVEIAYETAENR